jgi:hypothetical protein
MTVNERRKYLARMRHRYEKAGRKERSQLLDEMREVTGMHRKSLIRLLALPDLSRKPRRKQRGREYRPDVDDTIRVISESLDYVCAERLTPALAGMALHLSKFGEVRATPSLIAQLEQISVATVGRILRRLGQDTYRLPRKRPQPTRQIMREIPVGRIPWDECQPGHFEIDTVHHCGQAAVGSYVHTIQMVDVATGWSEREAALGRSQAEFEVALGRIKARLPMSVVQLHMDNGPEFLNDHFVRCWKEDAKGLRLSRSRPYHKNDNRFVEQKQSSLVRSYFGDVRFDTRRQCEKMNEIYGKLWIYNNLFQPVMRLSSKEFLAGANGGHKPRHKHDTAQTPFDRLCATGAIDQTTKDKLTALRDSTNPRQLRKEIYQLLDELWGLVSEPQNRPDFTPSREAFQAETTQKGGKAPVTLSIE